MDSPPRDARAEGDVALRLTRCISASLLLGGCASPGMPPGGPPDVQAPRLVAVAPESGRVSVSPRGVIFRFDEVVGETPPGATTLADLFVISPQRGTPFVEWRREEISVRPRRGWKPNTVYSVQMLPGLADLRGNVRKEGAATLFATGASIPATRIAGRLFNWVEGRPVSAGLVQAMAPDSTIYLAYSDSAGAFALPHLPPGTYELKGVIDVNRNRALDPREAWDTSSVVLADTARIELFAFVHDSMGPRIQTAVATDSVTLRVGFDVPVDARTPFDPSWISVVGADSVPLAIASVSPVTDVAPDTAAVPPRATETVMGRPRPLREVIVVMAAQLQADVTYTVVAQGFPGLLGRTTLSRATFRLPAPRAAPP